MKEKRRGRGPYDLSEAFLHAACCLLRIGIDTEWTDGEAASDDEAAETCDAVDERRASRAGPPRLAVVQLAVSGGRAWVIDALDADNGAALGSLLRWMLECERLIVLGFAFRGDLAVLQPLCGQPALRVSSLVDLQALGRQRGSVALC